jgi:hypothetical protein
MRGGAIRDAYKVLFGALSPSLYLYFHPTQAAVAVIQVICLRLPIHYKWGRYISFFNLYKPQPANIHFPTDTKTHVTMGYEDSVYLAKLAEQAERYEGRNHSHPHFCAAY